MPKRTHRITVAALTAASALAASGAALAQEEGGPDGARFRGGVRGEGGVMVFPDEGEALPLGGVQGEFGAQINDLVGVYFAPSLDIIFGTIGGPSFNAAVIVDFTLDDTFQIGVGPDVGAFAAIGEGAAGAAALYGGRLHFAAYPLVDDGDDGIRRKGLSLGVDLRVLTGGSAFATTTTGTASANTFCLQPTLHIGYSAF